jgi:hypothetical protein
MAAVASTAPSGFDGNGSTLTSREALAAASTTVEKATEVRMIEEAAAAKAIEEALAAKMAADEAAVAKVVEEAVVKMVTDEATTKIADHGAAWVKATMKSVGSDSSPAPAVGTKRAAAPGGSTPPSKQFHCTWKPRYAEQLLSRFFLFIYIHSYYI